MRTLVAGFGNVLRGDDGFGVEVVRRLGPMVTSRPDVEVMEVGTGGIRLAQELLTPYDRLLVVDAMTRGGRPGTVYVLAVESVESFADIDMHLAVPARALALARALGALPREVFMVGCEPGEVDELTTELTPAVLAAVDHAIERIEALLGAPARSPVAAPGPDTMRDLELRDEILQILFWLHGEGLGSDVTVADVTRFVDDRVSVRRVLGALADDGYVDALDGGAEPARYRLTPFGEREGRRRFLDEFEPYLARHAHGQCGAADCDCAVGGAECRGPA